MLEIAGKFFAVNDHLSSFRSSLKCYCQFYFKFQGAFITLVMHHSFFPIFHMLHDNSFFIIFISLYFLAGFMFPVLDLMRPRVPGEPEKVVDQKGAKYCFYN